MALGQHLSGVPGEFGFDEHWNDVEGALAFLLVLVGQVNSRGSYSPLWHVRGPGGIGNRSSNCASWILPPSYSAT